MEHMGDTGIPVVRLSEVDSTNTWVKAHARMLDMPVMVYAADQRAGRGQRGNSWESEPGANLTCSMLFEPAGVAPRDQFAVSEAVALAVCGLLDTLSGGVVASCVKWPNDIYAGDRKICGILIEHSLYGPETIRHTIAGIGVNLNQMRFLSDAPNPVSLAQLTGGRYDVDSAARMLAGMVAARVESAADARGRAALHREFMSRLWRGTGIWPFRDTRTGERFEASVAGIAAAGTLCLRDTAETIRTYAFKEVEWLPGNTDAD